MRIFLLKRENPSVTNGLSSEAEGVEWGDGHVSVRWLGPGSRTEAYQSLDLLLEELTRSGSEVQISITSADDWLKRMRAT